MIIEVVYALVDESKMSAVYCCVEFVVRVKLLVVLEMLAAVRFPLTNIDWIAG